MSLDQQTKKNEERKLLEKAISHHEHKGKIAVVVWQRDCDMTEWTQLHRIPATVDAYQELEKDIYESAEGPVSFQLINEDDAKDFAPSSRDRILEAFENGSNYLV